MLACVSPATASAAGSISGTVTAASGGAPLSEVEVCAEGLDLGAFECVEPGFDGTYTIGGLEPGEYAVAFWPFGDNDYRFQYYDGKAIGTDADPVTVEDGVDSAGINGPC